MTTENLTTLQEAQLLVNRFYEVQINGNNMEYDSAVECAKIAVDEILKLLYSLKFGNALSEEIEYWDKVKHELTKQQEQ